MNIKDCQHKNQIENKYETSRYIIKFRTSIRCFKKSENLIGYFTKFGDGASDITPIISLYKLQVREIAKYLGVSENIISKKSSPHLWKDHEAEEELGASYEEIDSILYCLFEKKISIEETAKITLIEKSIVEKIYELNTNSEHKRLPAQKPKNE